MSLALNVSGRSSCDTSLLTTLSQTSKANALAEPRQISLKSLMSGLVELRVALHGESAEDSVQRYEGSTRTEQSADSLSTCSQLRRCAVDGLVKGFSVIFPTLDGRISVLGDLMDRVTQATDSKPPTDSHSALLVVYGTLQGPTPLMLSLTCCVAPRSL